MDEMKCPVEVTIKVIGGRWKVIILWHLLLRKVQRFSELQRSIEGVTQKMLTQQLREMEKNSIIRRKVYPQIPPKVEYSVTPLGESLYPILKNMCEWGIQYMEENNKEKIDMDEETKCPVEVTIKVIGGRWKVLILWRLLLRKVQRFSELQRSIKGVTQKMLTQQLREMEKDSIIRRKVYPQVPPKVEYSVTPLGESLYPILKNMCEWGIQYMEENNINSGEVRKNCIGCSTMESCSSDAG